MFGVAAMAPSTIPAHLLPLPFLPSVRRHDDPPTPTEPPQPPVPAEPPPAPAPRDPAAAPQVPAPSQPDSEPEDDGLKAAGKKALAAERAKAREAEAAARAAAADAAAAKERLAKAERTIQEFEDAKKSELEKAQAAAERAMAQVQAANRRAVTSELRSVSVGRAADPDLVVELLAARGVDRFITDTGIASDAIQQAVTELLEERPILRVPDEPAEPPKPPKPKPPAPDPGQGPTPGSGSPDFRDPAALAAEMSKFNVRPTR